MVYKWKVPIYEVSAQKAGEELERIGLECGGITPEKIVEESKDPDAVLHKCFEWNDERAAHQYRIAQAQKIIRTITVEIERKDTLPVQVRAFFPVQDAYTPIQKILSEPSMTDVLLRDAKAQLASFYDKYKILSELCGVMAEIEKFLAA